MIVDAVNLDHQALTFQHVGDVLLIRLPAGIKEMTELCIIVRYHGIPADGLRIGPTKFGERSFFSENWPNKAHHWLPCVDHPYDKATSEFIVRTPLHYKVISNGLLMEESNLDSSTKLTHWKQMVAVSTGDFIHAMENASGKHLQAFFDQWLNHGENPSLKGGWKYDPVKTNHNFLDTNTER